MHFESIICFASFFFFAFFATEAVDGFRRLRKHDKSAIAMVDPFGKLVDSFGLRDLKLLKPSLRFCSHLWV